MLLLRVVKIGLAATALLCLVVALRHGHDYELEPEVVVNVPITVHCTKFGDVVSGGEETIALPAGQYQATVSNGSEVTLNVRVSFLKPGSPVLKEWKFMDLAPHTSEKFEAAPGMALYIYVHREK